MPSTDTDRLTQSAERAWETIYRQGLVAGLRRAADKLESESDRYRDQVGEHNVARFGLAMLMSHELREEATRLEQEGS